MIILDPGHGGKETGIITPSGLNEADITLRIALLTQKKLTHNYNALVTRKTDTDVSYSDRIFLANNNKADLFISIHLNNSNQEHGYFFIFEPPDLKPKKILSNSILWKEQPLIKSKENKLLLTAFTKTFSTNRATMKFFPQNAPLLVLEGLKMPGMIIEPFPISLLPESSEEQDQFLEHYTDLIVDSINLYFKIKRLASQKQK